MKKTILILVAALFSANMWAEKQGGTLTSSTTPINPSETVTLNYDGTGTNFANWEPKCHIYARLDAKSGKTFSKEYTTGWATCDGDANYDALPDKVKMTFVSKGKYSISMNIKSFFDVTDDDLEKIDKLCVVVRSQYNGEDNQTEDMFLNVSTPTKFFITGDSALVVDAGLNKAKAWNEYAIKSTEDSYTIAGLKANVKYQLKVVATSAEWKGYSDLTGTPAAGLYTDDDGNICFRLSAAGSVTVNYTSSAFTLSGSFKTVSYNNVKLVPGIWSADSPKYAAWTWGADGYKAWTAFATGSGDTVSLQVNADADSIIFTRMNPALTEPKWNTETEKNNVWNEAEKTKIDKVGLTYSITGWGEGEGAKSTGTWEALAKYYVTGDSALVVDINLPKDSAWKTKAYKVGKDTISLTLKAGQQYKLKVTVDGSWDTAKGYSDLTTKANGLKTDGDNNIVFTLNTAGMVKVTYSSTEFKLEGDFYVKPVENKTVKLVPSEEWNEANAKFAVWSWGEEQEGTWTNFFSPISADNDTLSATIKTSADSIEFVRFSPKAKAPTWEQDSLADVLVWGKIKDTIDWKGLTATVVGWDSLTWKAVERPCESFGLVINGVYKPGKKNVLQTEWLEYKLLSIALDADDSLQVRNGCSGDTWIINKYASTSYEFKKENGKYVVEEAGTYDFYLKLIPDNDEIYISKAGHYTQSVPTQCEDILMQAFYNESYSSSAPGVSDSWAIGDTKWATLDAQADTLGKYFDLIWLAPSANGDGMGYHPKNYGNQSSNWGSAEQLATLINDLHNAGAKVVADIVINHCQSSNGWLGFPEFDFGTYGKFQVDASWICQNDEVNADWNKDKAGSDWGKATGNYDDGENWEGARDWAHDMPKVQNMFKAYLKWMRNTVGYDGFRYDKGDGFNNWHHDNYNKAAGPYIAFMECYSGTDEIWTRIQGANYNLMALDFDTKWHVFDAFAGWDYDGKYGKPRGDGLLGRNNGRYAVTFIDSHDWFLRSDNDNEFGGRGNSLTEALKCRLLQANAFMLSMPGVPCVFYPHWKKYDGFIKPMIQARKLAGVHSESEVKDEYATSTGYQATIVGKDGFLILCLGDKAHQSFEGYTCMASYYETNDAGQGKDASYQIWVQRTTPLPTDIEAVTNEPVIKAEKVLMNGQLYIRMGDKTYDLTGKQIK